MKSVKIRYFAMLREEAGIDEESLVLDIESSEDLYDFLKLKHNFSLEKNHIQVAVNDEFSSLKRQIQNGDTIVFIPPVAGG